MSALFKAEIENLMLLVEKQAIYMAADTNERERLRTDRKRQDEIDRQAVLDMLTAANKPITSIEIANATRINRTRVDRILAELLKKKTATRRRGAVRRDDGGGYRSAYRYRIAPRNAGVTGLAPGKDNK